jgi:hypothetical protein
VKPAKLFAVTAGGLGTGSKSFTKGIVVLNGEALSLGQNVLDEFHESRKEIEVIV